MKLLLKWNAMSGVGSQSEIDVWKHLQRYREVSSKTQKELDALLANKIGKFTSEDTSLVVFGSLARGEWTTHSDLDWTYLIDGGANSDHLLIAQNIKKVLEEAKYQQPGPTGTFGNMAFSHDIIHQIGGQNDTNRNTSQRILLLLESCAIGQRTEAYDRVIRGVINRYLEEDNHPLDRESKSIAYLGFYSMISSVSGERWR